MAFDLLVVIRMFLSRLLACLGHLDQALVEQDATLGEARRLSHPPTLAVALGGAGWVTGSFVRLKPGSLLEHADELLALTTEHGIELHRMAALIRRGWCLAALGHADEGIPLITAGVAGSPPGVPGGGTTGVLWRGICGTGFTASGSTSEGGWMTPPVELSRPLRVLPGELS
jgi:hypothetical protein